ncbi:MAG: 2-phosphosulfolactate phosphatase [Marinoscillum sp.]|jgi:2-phosphosulfolactate phosphatase
MRTVEVCLTPELIHQFNLEGKIVVVVDVFRATSCMVSGIATGVTAIYPVATVEECLALGQQGMTTAGERGGIKVEGFDIGNSPFEYMAAELVGKKVSVSTTNGTKTILASLGASQILIGAFLNLSATAEYLKKANKDVIIHCAGWQGTVNIEDTLYAGALADAISITHGISGDPALLAHQLFIANKTDLMPIAQASSHAQRLSGFGAKEDLVYCMEQSKYEIVVEYAEKAITLLK